MFRSFRTKFKILLLVDKNLDGFCPYLCLTFHELPTLRSSGGRFLIIPRIRTKAYITHEMYLFFHLDLNYSSLMTNILILKCSFLFSCLLMSFVYFKCHSSVFFFVPVLLLIFLVCVYVCWYIYIYAYNLWLSKLGVVVIFLFCLLS